jgi:hypothetical protein
MIQMSHFLEPYREDQTDCEAGVIVMFLPPSLLDLNPIEEYFGVPKKFIKNYWDERSLFRREFKMCMQSYVDVVSDSADIAESLPLCRNICYTTFQRNENTIDIPRYFTRALYILCSGALSTISQCYSYSQIAIQRLASLCR